MTKTPNRRHLDDLVEAVEQRLTERLRVVLQQAVERGDVAWGAVDAVREEFVASIPADLRDGGLKDLTEFGRAVHAEMDALLDAARRGVPVAGATLYTTTFPCHNCARHIIAAGLSRVVFIEPYTKSRAEDLHGEAITIAHSEPGDKLAFEPFVGVAPRRYLEMFDAQGRSRSGHVARKDKEGKKQALDKATALPVFADAGLAQFRPKLPGYRAKELLALDHFKRLNTEEAAAGELPAAASEESTDAASDVAKQGE